MALIAVRRPSAWVDVARLPDRVVTVLSGADYFFGLRRRLSERRPAHGGRAPSQAAPAGGR